MLLLVVVYCMFIRLRVFLALVSLTLCGCLFRYLRVSRMVVVYVIVVRVLSGTCTLMRITICLRVLWAILPFRFVSRLTMRSRCLPVLRLRLILLIALSNRALILLMCRLKCLRSCLRVPRPLRRVFWLMRRRLSLRAAVSVRCPGRHCLLLLCRLRVVLLARISCAVVRWLLRWEVLYVVLSPPRVLSVRTSVVRRLVLLTCLLLLMRLMRLVVLSCLPLLPRCCLLRLSLCRKRHLSKTLIIRCAEYRSSPRIVISVNLMCVSAWALRKCR